MTHLRKMMLEELQRRNYSENTTRSYIRTVEDFARRFQPSRRTAWGHDTFANTKPNCSRKRKFAASTVTVYLAALRFFYTKTLKRVWSTAETPYPKRVSALPTVLSQEEVAQLIDAALTPFHRTLLMTLYATGLRRAELAHLKVTDIDSQRMVVHVQGGKGRKDRDVMLSPKLLDEFRKHWRRLKRKPSVWLFPGNRHHSSDQPDFHESGLACVPQCRPASGHQKTGAPAYPSSLLRDASPGTGCGPAQHPDAVRPQRSGTDHHLPPHFPTPPERDRQSAGLTVTEK